jgi:hypothetical protein
MNNSTRLLSLIFANAIIVSIALYFLNQSGIDVISSTLLDNADSLRFIFDFLAIVIALFVVNFSILSYPSRKHRVLTNTLFLLISNKNLPTPKRPHKKPNLV